MAFSQKTPNYDLGIWQDTDTMSYQDWNQNATLIDSQMKVNADAAASASEIASEAKNTADGAAQTIGTLSTTVNELNGKVTHIDSDIDSLFTSMNQAETDISGLRTQVESAETNVTNLSSQVTSMQSAVDKSTTDIASINQDMSGFTSSLGNTQEQVGALTSRMATAENDISQLTTSVESNTNEVNELSGDVASVQEDITAMKGYLTPKHEYSVNFSFDSTPTPMQKLHCSTLGVALRNKLVELTVTIHGAGFGLIHKNIIYPNSIGNFVVQNDTSAKMIAVTLTPNSSFWDILMDSPDHGTLVVDDVTATIKLIAVPQ